MWSYLVSLFNWIWDWVKWIFGAAQQHRNLSPVVYTIAHWVTVVVVVVVLGVFSQQIQDFTKIGTPETGYEFVRTRFWGIVALSAYLFVRLVIYVVELFRIQEPTEFEDINIAWSKALFDLQRVGLDIYNIPIFILSGLQEQDEAAFLMGSGFQAQAVGPAVDEPSPVRIYANRDAMLITLPGVSAVSEQLRNRGGTSSFNQTMVPRFGADQTIAPGGGSGMLAGTTTEPENPGATIDPRQMAQMKALGSANVAELTDMQLARCRARINHFCKLLTDARYPVCPINGAIESVPLAWSRSDRPDLFRAVQADAQQLTESLGMQFPLFCMQHGLEGITGFTDFLSRCTAADSRFSKNTRAGARYATGQPVSAQNTAWAATRSLEWFEQWIHACFAADPSNATNGRLYRMWCQLNETRGSLAKLLQLGFESADLQCPLRLSGLYFAGLDGRKTAFVRDVIARVQKEQEKIAWTPTRIYQDASYHWWAKMVWGLAGLLFVLDAWLAWGLWGS